MPATAALTGTPASISAKAERNAATDAASAQAIEKLCGEGSEFAGREREVKEAVRSLTKRAVRKRIVDDGLRIDGRGPRDLRPVSSEVTVLPTAHGTGLFHRGETQVLNVVTMAMPRMNQLMDTLSPETHKYFLFHYNMAPWANGETGRVGTPKRREIGHGALAARALLPVLPSQEEFSYTLRLVAEVLASNGSTSMASVCSGSLALMDAGVPVKAAVAGIAMGLVYAEGKYTTLTDILGAEDAFGDMDFKVAGTSEFITALQLDTKIEGIPADVLAAAHCSVAQSRSGTTCGSGTCTAAAGNSSSWAGPWVSPPWPCSPCSRCSSSSLPPAPSRIMASPDGWSTAWA
jgi:polyribonucleotide nucleotidyltransferase